MSNDAREVRAKKESETRNVTVNFADVLDENELLTGIPLVADTESPQSLVIDNIQINTVALTVEGESVSIGQAIQFRVSGGTIGQHYISISCGTDSTPAQSIGPKLIVLLVIPDI